VNPVSCQVSKQVNSLSGIVDRQRQTRLDTTEGTALSRNRAAMLEATRPVSTGAANQSRASASGSRSSRRKRRRNIVLPAFFVAIMLVAVVAVGAKVMSRNGSGASNLAQALDALPRSGSVALIVKERDTIIVMDAASKTLTVASKPAIVNPAQVVAAQNAAANSSSSSTNTTTVSAPPPDPGTAQEIGYDMLPQFGFNQTTQWTCLLDLWNRESGWLYDAENPSSGAYGIPQALPGDKMASAGADWETDPTTQIRWGLGYISQTYGTPCAAYDFDVANGGY
jgi:hypothetical protein